MPIEKGRAWGAPGPFPSDGVVVGSDAEARAVIEKARAERQAVPSLGLLGGDLCRTLGGGDAGGDRGGEGRLRSVGGVCFPIDLGEAIIDGRIHFFVAHLVARSRLWTRAFVAMNAQWIGTLNLGPRAHPGDGLLDTYDAHLSPTQVLAVRSRAHHGSHLPHPGIHERRVPALQSDFDSPLSVYLDGEPAGSVRRLSLRVEPDALRVVV
ncbi:MAG: hypothetical protein M3Z84_08745 [Actinomycetota bacterium]|nr:hypothetical protein [Actinomycetota bacterium]